jgi:protein translocase SecG subunit
MSIVVTILFVLTAFLLIGVVLVQQPKTAGGLFSGTGQSLLGTSGKSFWTRFTVILAGVFMALCLVMSFVNRNPASNSVMDQATQPSTSAAPASTQNQVNPQAQTKPGTQSQTAPSLPGAAKP